MQLSEFRTGAPVSDLHWQPASRTAIAINSEAARSALTTSNEELTVAAAVAQQQVLPQHQQQPLKDSTNQQHAGERRLRSAVAMLTII